LVFDIVPPWKTQPSSHGRAEGSRSPARSQWLAHRPTAPSDGDSSFQADGQFPLNVICMLMSRNAVAYSSQARASPPASTGSAARTKATAITTASAARAACNAWGADSTRAPRPGPRRLGVVIVMQLAVTLFEVPLLSRRSRSTDHLLFGRNKLIVLSGSPASSPGALGPASRSWPRNWFGDARLPMNRRKVPGQQRTPSARRVG
jgi:hypothetical protein